MENELRNAMEPIFVNASIESLYNSLSEFLVVLEASLRIMGRDSVCRICDNYMREEVRATSISAILTSILSKHPDKLAEICSKCLSMLLRDTVACGVRNGVVSRLTIVPGFSLQLEYGEYSDDWTACRVWPGGEYLSRQLILNSYSVEGCDVLELGSGLGIGGISALHAGASRVAFTEYKQELLDVALRNVSLNIPIGQFSGFILDWETFDPSLHEEFQKWKTGEFVIIASEIIYEETHPELVFNLLNQLFLTGASRAYIVVMRRPFRSGLVKFLEMLETQPASFRYIVSDPSDDAACVELFLK